MSAKKEAPNQFAAIIAARQKEDGASEPAAPPPSEVAQAPTPARASGKSERTSKRGNPDYSPVTVYIPTEIYARAQFEMSRKGRKREMSDLFTELLETWLAEQE